MKRWNTRMLVVTAMLSAIASVLMFLDFPVFFMPGFIKMDISELPALIASFSMGPVSGIVVCLIKNLVNLLTKGFSTGGVGELCNFLLGVCFVVPAGWIYKVKKSRKSALIGCLVGAVLMAAMSLPINYFVTYPMYSRFMPIDAIIGMYQKINPNVNGLFACLLIFNVPFTFLKGVIDSVIAFIIYKPLSRLIKGNAQQPKKSH